MRVLRSLGSRLLAAHLVVVLATVLTVLVAARLITPSFYRSHVETMAAMMGGMASGLEQELEAGFQTAFGQALVVSVMIGVGVALLVSVVGTRRVVRPINAVRRATRRLAAGNYGERVELPAEEELAALAADVNHLAEALEDTETRRLRLLGDATHELRTPLTTIEGYMEAILDGVLEPTPDIIAAVAHEARRLKRLATDLSLLSRAEESILELDQREVDVAELVVGVTSRLEPQYREQEVALEVSVYEGATADVDADRITQVLTNLVGNALTYTPGGGSVSVGMELTPSEVAVRVSDTGRGVAPDDLERIFERFYRVDRSAPGGMGIGLTLARSMARLHGGDVSAISDGIGGGTTFILRLPRSRVDRSGIHTESS